MNIRLLGETEVDRAAQLQKMFPTVSIETTTAIVAEDKKWEAGAAATNVKPKIPYTLYAALAAGAYLMFK